MVTVVHPPERAARLFLRGFRRLGALGRLGAQAFQHIAARRGWRLTFSRLIGRSGHRRILTRTLKYGLAGFAAG